jgi:hypothetical protein
MRGEAAEDRARGICTACRPIQLSQLAPEPKVPSPCSRQGQSQPALGCLECAKICRGHRQRRLGRGEEAPTHCTQDKHSAGGRRRHLPRSPVLRHAERERPPTADAVPARPWFVDWLDGDDFRGLCLHRCFRGGQPDSERRRCAILSRQRFDRQHRAWNACRPSCLPCRRWGARSAVPAVAQAFCRQPGSRHALLRQRNQRGRAARAP